MEKDKKIKVLLAECKKIFKTVKELRYELRTAQDSLKAVQTENETYKSQLEAVFVTVNQYENDIKEREKIIAYISGKLETYEKENKI